MSPLTYILGWFGYVKIGSGAVRTSNLVLEYLQETRPIVAQYIPDMRGPDALIEFQQALVKYLKTGQELNEQQTKY